LTERLWAVFLNEAAIPVIEQVDAMDEAVRRAAELASQGA
jgi:hypothetical protein